MNIRSENDESLWKLDKKSGIQKGMPEADKYTIFLFEKTEKSQ